MVRFTLDTNCLIDVEEARADAPYIRELVSRQGNGITVAVSAIGASERQRNGGYARNFSEFQQKLNAVGFGALEILLPLAYMDICFLDRCVMADEADTLERDIHAVLFPNIEFLWIEYASARGLSVDAIDKTWRNAKCDVLGLWCHIKHGGGVFVTSDGNFHAATKQAKLKALGAGTIAYPKNALDGIRGRENMKLVVAIFAVIFVALAAACATVRQQDLDAWVGMPVEALDTHSLFITVPMYRTVTASGIEIRNYSNGRDVANCFGTAGATNTGNFVNANAFTTCSSGRIVCNNIFYIKDGKVVEYAPTGQCFTDERVQPQARYLRLRGQ